MSANSSAAGGGGGSEEPEPRDCVVCQNGPVNWVLLPCRHTCLCDLCGRCFRRCPMCRQPVLESFPLRAPRDR